MRRGGDPYWLRVKYSCQCSDDKCKAPIPKGDQGFYYPNGRKMLCQECGKKAEQDFSQHAFDEAQMNGGW
jgi:hypothetical protein